MAAERKDWLNKRRLSLGASEVAAILGLSPWESLYSVWAKKTRAFVDDDEETPWQYWGNLLEPVICEEYHKQTGRTIIDHGRYAVRYSETCPHLSATLDREVVAFDDRGPGCMDAKNVNAFKANDWSDGVPLVYQIQLQAQMEVTGYRWGSLAALIGGSDFRWKDVERDDAFIAMMRRKVAEFWQLVETATPPPIDGSASTAEVLRRLYPNDKGTSAALPGEAMKWTDEYQTCAMDIDALKERQQLMKNQLIDAIGDNAFGVCPDGRKWSYKADKNGKRSLRLMGQ